MTVIAWDGKTLATGRQLQRGDTLGEASKMRRLTGGRVMAWAGVQSLGLIMAERFEQGTLLSEWPEWQKTDDWTLLVVAHPNRTLEYFERYPMAVRVETKIWSTGIGREAAYGAMEAGADAVRAVEIACKWIAGCGKGVDAFDLIDGQFVRR